MFVHTIRASSYIMNKLWIFLFTKYKHWPVLRYQVQVVERVYQHRFEISSTCTLAIFQPILFAIRYEIQYWYTSTSQLASHLSHTQSSRNLPMRYLLPLPFFRYFCTLSLISFRSLQPTFPKNIYHVGVFNSVCCFSPAKIFSCTLHRSQHVVNWKSFRILNFSHVEFHISSKLCLKRVQALFYCRFWISK